MSAKLADKELIKELRRLRMGLAGFLTEKNITILMEAEKRLTGVTTVTPDKIPPKKRKGNITSTEAFAKYYLK